MNTPRAARGAPPWHLWLVGLATLLFNAMGIISYTATRLGMLAELGRSPDQIAFMNSYPAWISGFWALGVWGAFAGSVLLLLRSRWAVAAMALALIGLIGTTTGNYLVLDVPPAMQAPLLDAAIWAVTLFTLAYTRRMAAIGVLR
jgi:hypothetical protein